jgi:hypothetical protein
MNLAFSGYNWVAPSTTDKKGCFILPKSSDIDLLFQENTSLHIIIFLKLLSKDLAFLKSIFHVPKRKKNFFPRIISIYVFRNNIRDEMVLDTHYVVDEAEEPIFVNESDMKCLWP